MLSYEVVRKDLMFIKLLRERYFLFNSADVLLTLDSSFWNEVRYKTQSQWNDFVNNEIMKLINHDLRNPYIQRLRQLADEMIIDKAYIKRFSSTPRIAWFSLLYMCKNCLIESVNLLEEMPQNSMSVEEACVFIDENPFSYGLKEMNANTISDSAPDKSAFLNTEEVAMSKGLELNISDDNQIYCNCITPAFKKINSSPVTHAELTDEIMRYIDEAPVYLKTKINYLNRLKTQWANSYNNHLNDFDCIEVKNEEQVIYLWNYLKRKKLIPHFLKPVDTEMRYHMLISCLDNWSPLLPEIKNKLIKSMFHAWSEHKRQEKPSKNQNNKSKSK
ncbi:hypothetical protein COR05_14315 [Salmonella enterica]|nr:hypothetical protein [Salmonella enterica]ECD1122568.1 hypothetical protein [Salmonella enterica subsp. enterica serovar Oakland]EKR1833512.1 hypothetical protein [Salmonella enterica subsp. enterica serovar Cerro]ELI0329011.1 hypothetical protein [Salmonella enterica]